MSPIGIGNRNEKIALVVEDSPTQASQIKYLLKNLGIKVIVAHDGIIGLQMAIEIIPVIIVLDVQMPGLNGFEMFTRLKRDRITSEIPVIIFSHKDATEAIQTGLALGAVNYIPKDAFANAVLVETLRQMGMAKV